MVQKNSSLSVEQVAQVFQFEHWLRFYFIKENQDKSLVFDFDQDFLQDLGERYGKLAELARELNGKKLTPKLSQEIIVKFLQKHLAEKTNRDVISPLLDSKSFLREMQLFHLWVSLLENELEKQVLPFETWLGNFQKWKQTDQAKQILCSLKVNSDSNLGSKKIN